MVKLRKGWIEVWKRLGEECGKAGKGWIEISKRLGDSSSKAEERLDRG